MGTSVVVTGTGTPLATADRAGAGVLVRHGDLDLQFDAGRATVPRLLAAGSSPAALSALFLTHYRSDHIVGLQDVVLSHWTMDVYDEAPRLPILAPNGPTIRFCERMLDLWDDDLEVRARHNGHDPRPKIDTIGFDPPETPAPSTADDRRAFVDEVREGGYTGEIMVCDDLDAVELR